MDAATSDPFLAHPVGRWLVDRQNRLRRLDRRRPWLFDTAVAAVILAMSLPQVIPGGLPMGTTRCGPARSGWRRRPCCWRRSGGAVAVRADSAAR